MPSTKSSLLKQSMSLFLVLLVSCVAQADRLKDMASIAGVRSNALCPGGVENGQSIDFLDRVSKKIPMGRLAKPDEYQGTLIWMLSDASSYLNGAIIPVDGGRTAW